MAKTDLARLVVSLEAQNTQLLQKLDQSEKRTKKWQRKVEGSVGKVSNAFKGLLTGAAVLGGFNAVLKATAEQERALVQLETALKSTGNTTGLTSQQLQQFASDLQKSTTFSDDAILGLETRLASFGKISGDVFKRATAASLDLSARMGKDLLSSATQVGKALNDPIKGLAGLSRAGIQFSKDQREVIVALAETGRLAEAQGIILDALEAKFGGAAEAARGTFSGSLAALKNAFGELLEAPGGLQDATAGINEFTDLLQDPETVQAAGRMADGVIAAFVGISRAITSTITEMTGFGKFIGESIAAMGEAGAALDDLPRAEKAVTDAGRDLSAAIYDMTRGEGAQAYVDAAKKRLDEANAKLAAARSLVEGNLLGRVPLPAGAPAPAQPPERPARTEIPALASLKPPELRDTKWLKATVAEGEALFKGLEEQWKRQADAFAEVEQLKFDLLDEEGQSIARLQADYIKLQNAVADGGTTQQAAAEIAAGLSKKWAEEQAALQQQQLDSMLSGLLTEEELLAQSYMRRREEILASSVGTAEMRNEAVHRLDQKFNEESLALNGDFWDRWLEAAEENLNSLDKITADVLSNISSQFGSALESIVFDFTTVEDAVSQLAESMLRSLVNALGQMAAQWLIYKAVQAASQGTAASAGAIAMTAQAQAQSMMAGLSAFSSTAAIPIVGPAAAPAAMAAAIAATQPMAAAVAALAGQAAAASYGGAFDAGGFIPAGKFGLVGERGPELVNGPATVTGRMDTARVFDFGRREENESSSGSKLRIVNAFDTGVIGDYLGSDAGEKLILNVVKRNGRTMRAAVS